MGQAKNRGTFEDRKKKAVSDKNEPQTSTVIINSNGNEDPLVSLCDAIVMQSSKQTLRSMENQVVGLVVGAGIAKDGSDTLCLIVKCIKTLEVIAVPVTKKLHDEAIATRMPKLLAASEPFKAAIFDLTKIVSFNKSSFVSVLDEIELYEAIKTAVENSSLIADTSQQKPLARLITLENFADSDVSGDVVVEESLKAGAVVFSVIGTDEVPIFMGEDKAMIDMFMAGYEIVS